MVGNKRGCLRGQRDLGSAREALVEGGRVERLETRIDAGKLKGAA